MTLPNQPKLLPTRLANPSNPPVRRTNRESTMQNPKLHRVRHASGFVQIPLSQVRRRDALPLTPNAPRRALVDRALGFLNTNQANKFGLILVVVRSSQENA